MMRSVGVDMSTSPSSTGWVVLHWDGLSPARVEEIHDRKRSSIVEQIRARAQDEWWAVDVPFGWPVDFATWVADHSRGPVPPALDIDGRHWSHLARRCTDEFVHAHNGTPGAGFSVSFDKLGATAAAWASIEAALAAGNPPLTVDRAGCCDEDGDLPVVETWPSAAWRAFFREGDVDPGNPATMSPDSFRSALAGVVELTPDLYCLGVNDRSAHYRDALVCALVARARSLGQTMLPTGEDRRVAEREGWVHLPSVPLHRLVHPTPL